MTDCNTHSLVRARKPHQCECHRTKLAADGERDNVPCHIAPGEIYEVSSGIFDGQPYRNYLCLFHAAVSDMIWNSDWKLNCLCKGIDYDELGYYCECSSAAEWLALLASVRKRYRQLKVQAAEKRNRKVAK